MFRIIIIFSLLFYVLYKFGFFRSLSEETRQNRKPRHGNVNVDSAPQKEKKRSDFKGGEYVDYEEVK